MSEGGKHLKHSSSGQVNDMYYILPSFHSTIQETITNFTLTRPGKESFLLFWPAKLFYLRFDLVVAICTNTTGPRDSIY